MSHVLGFSFGTKQQHSWKSGSRNALMHTQTQRKEVCVVDGDEGRAIKKPGSRWEECPGMPHMTKAWKLVCPMGGFKLQTDFGSSVGENKFKCHSSIFVSFHNTCSHTTPQPLRHNSETKPHEPYCTATYSIQYVCPSHTLVVVFVLDTGTLMWLSSKIQLWPTDFLGQWIIIAHVV